MGVAFFESMRGELTDQSGVARHVAFDVRCERRGLAGLLAGRAARLTGTVRALPWVDVAPCAGTVIVDPLFGRRIEYDIAFDAEDGTPMRLWGRKDVDPLHPLASMTSMRTRLSLAGEVVATGTLRFDLNDLPAFLRSWSPHAALRPAPAPSPTLPSIDPLSGDELAAMTAFAEAIIVPGQLVPPVDPKTVERAARALDQAPPHVRALFRGGLRALNALARARHCRSFRELTLARRVALIEALGSTTAGAAVVMGLAMTIKSAHFSRRAYLDAVGVQSYDNPVCEPEPAWLANALAPEDLDERTVLEADVVVVGTGAGGGPVAATLAAQGLGVALVEEGRYHRRRDFAGGAEERLQKLWRDGGMSFTLGNLPVMVPTGRTVGGSTAINSGTCYRTPDAVLQQWRAAGLPVDFEPARFGRWLDAVEAELGVEPADSRYLGEIAQIVARGADAMGAQHGPLLRNAPGCDGQGVCVVGCPTGAKRSSDVSWVPRALRAGAALVTGLPVTRVLMSGRRAVGVVASGHDESGAPREVVVRARAVVLACGTLQSPVLLHQTGIRLPWLGRNLSVHPAQGVYARFDEPIGQPWRAIPQSYGVEGLVDPRVRFEGFYAPPALAAPSLPFVGAELTRWMDAWGSVAQFGFMVRDRGTGSVRPGPGGRPLVRYHVGDDVVDLFRRGNAALAELLLRGGAREVATGIEGVPAVRSVADARAIANRRLSAHHFKSMAFHPLGTCRIGRSADEAVVDFEHRVFGTENLYVADGSTVPTSLGVNPQVTIMAMALRCAEALGASLST